MTEGMGQKSLLLGGLRRAIGEIVGVHKCSPQNEHRTLNISE